MASFRMRGRAALLLAAAGLASGLGIAQADDLLDRAQAAVESGDRVSARALAVEKLLFEPDHAGATIFLARLDAWEGRYDPARDALARVLAQEPGNVDGHLALIDVEHWSGRHEAAEAECAKATAEVRSDDRFAKRCRRIAGTMRAKTSVAADPEGARATATSSSRRAADRIDDVRRTAALGWRITPFDSGPNTWHAVFLDVERSDDYLTLGGRLAFDERFGNEAFVGGIHSRLRLSEVAALELGFDYSTGDILPDWRLFGAFERAIPVSLVGRERLTLRGGLELKDYEDAVSTLSLSAEQPFGDWSARAFAAIDGARDRSRVRGGFGAAYRFGPREDVLSAAVEFGHRLEQEQGPVVPGVGRSVRVFDIAAVGFTLGLRKELIPDVFAVVETGAAFEERLDRDRTRFVFQLGFEKRF